jgi:hypothetical protein
MSNIAGLPIVCSGRAEPNAILGADEDDWNPCPQGIVQMLKTLVAPTQNGGVLLDNCAGDGKAAMHLARTWKLRGHLVEPNPRRLAACLRQKDAICVLGRAESLYSSCAPSVWFFNPPFDPGDPTERLECSLFEVSVPYAIGVHTLAILLLPERSLRNNRITCLISKFLGEIKIRRFPEPWRRAHRQVVVFGYGVRVRGDLNEGEALTEQFACPDVPRIELRLLRAHEFQLPIRLKADRFSLITATSPTEISNPACMNSVRPE